MTTAKEQMCRCGGPEFRHPNEPGPETCYLCVVLHNLDRAEAQIEDLRADLARVTEELEEVVARAADAELRAETAEQHGYESWESAWQEARSERDEAREEVDRLADVLSVVLTDYKKMQHVDDEKASGWWLDAHVGLVEERVAMIVDDEGIEGILLDRDARIRTEAEAAALERAAKLLENCGAALAPWAAALRLGDTDEVVKAAAAIRALANGKDGDE